MGTGRATDERLRLSSAKLSRVLLLVLCCRLVGSSWMYSTAAMPFIVTLRVPSVMSLAHLKADRDGHPFASSLLVHDAYSP